MRVALGLMLVALFYAQYELSGDAATVNLPSHTVVFGAETGEVDPFEHLVRTNPLQALLESRKRHRESVTDYTCNFVKQELLPSGMSAEQEIDVKFRAEPFSVVMHWVRNPGLAERVIYVKDKWVDADADAGQRQQAVCRPIPPISALLKSLKQPIHGNQAKNASRRFIDEFGFERSLDLLIQYCEMARDRGELRLEFKGESYFDGRPTWVILRRLPYEKEGGRYPDRIAEIHIDKEYRIPVAVYCYAADEMTPESLLGKYEYRNIHLNPKLDPSDFDPKTYGM